MTTDQLVEISCVKSETLTYSETWQDKNNTGGGNGVVTEEISRDRAQCACDEGNKNCNRDPVGRKQECLVPVDRRLTRKHWRM
jgi:hypothetical protein